MKKTLPFFLIATIVVSLTACSGSADKKVPELADEMCDCFTNFQKTISADAKDLMKAVSVATDAQSEMMQGISKLKPEDTAAFGEKLKAVGTRGSDVYACMEAFDKKHSKETTKDEESLTEKLLAEMQKNANCPVGAAIVNLSLTNSKPGK
jgi:Sec-independent protein translocase protein TatA